MGFLFYRRPDFIKRPNGPMDMMSCQRMASKTYSSKKDLPKSISFDRVCDNRALPPCTLADFMDYLVYIAFDAENLQFFLWYRDYVKRFNELKRNQQASSPAMNPAFFQSAEGLTRQKSNNPLDDLVQYPLPSDYPNNTNQPFRDEVNKIAAHYIALGGPRELNLSHRDRVSTMNALQTTTHPSAFEHIASLIEITLRNQSHPNFVRWTICNGNRPKVVFIRGMGSLFTTIAITLTVVLCLSSWSRWWRIFVFIPYFMGITILTAAYKGICILLHHNGNMRSIRPWEDLVNDNNGLPNSPELRYVEEGKGGESRISQSESMSSHITKSKWLDTFGGRNEFENEDWIERWKNRPFIRRILEPTTKVYEDGIRILQETIVKQSQFWGLLGSTVMTVVVTAIPAGNYY